MFLKSRQFSVAFVGALLLAGCAPAPRIVERAPASAMEAARIGISVVSVAPWELYAQGLQPNFALSESQALTEATAATSYIEDRFARTLQTLVKLAPGTLTEVREEVSGDKTSSSKTRKSGPGDLSTVAGPTVPDVALPAAPAASSSAAVNAMLRYHLATALYQEVQLLNRYVKSSPRRKGYAPFVARLQINTNQFGSNTPYNTDVEIEFGPGACKEGSPIAIPLLVNDSMEIVTAASARQNVMTLGLALSALRGNVGLGLDTSSRAEQQLRALGNEYNSLLNVSSSSRCSISVHVGALAKDIDKHELVTQGHMVTVLLLVKKGEPGAESIVPFKANTTFSHARTGLILAGSPVSTHGDFAVEFWRKPVMPAVDQFVEFVLSNEKTPYSGVATLRGGDALVDEVFERACLRSGAVDPGSSSCAGKGVLFADDVAAVEERNSALIKFTNRFDEPARGKVKVGDAEFDRICIEVSKSRDSGLAVEAVSDVCASIGNIRVTSPPKKEPELTADVKVHEKVIVAQANGNSSIVVTVTFPKPPKDKSAPDRRPQRVSLNVDGGAVVKHEQLGGESNCVVLADEVRVTGDCSLRLYLANVSPRAAVKVTASAFRPGAKSDVVLSVDGAQPEVVLDPSHLCFGNHGCCGAAACKQAESQVVVVAPTRRTSNSQGETRDGLPERQVSGDQRPSDSASLPPAARRAQPSASSVPSGSSARKAAPAASGASHPRQGS